MDGRRAGQDVAAGQPGLIVASPLGDDAAWLASGDILAAPPAVHRVLLDLARQG